jgi:hypothetical protein
MDTSGGSLVLETQGTLFTSSWARGEFLGRIDPHPFEHLADSPPARSDPSAGKHQQQSIVIVPSNAKGLTLVRPMQVVSCVPLPSPLSPS